MTEELLQTAYQTGITMGFLMGFALGSLVTALAWTWQKRISSADEPDPESRGGFHTDVPPRW